jgi:hypothetical protein
MVIISVGLEPEKDCAGEAQQQMNTRDPSSLQIGLPISTNPQLSESKKNLVIGPIRCPTSRQTRLAD